MEGYKVFEPDWTCRGFQYEVGKTFEEDVTPSCCNRGFHFCKELKDYGNASALGNHASVCWGWFRCLRM